jgi:Tfp pilus assembly protein PilP
MNKAVVVLASLLILSACGKDADHPSQTKDWYMQHDAERHARVAECKNDAAQKVMPDCQNALDAQAQITAFGK